MEPGPTLKKIARNPRTINNYCMKMYEAETWQSFLVCRLLSEQKTFNNTSQNLAVVCAESDLEQIHLRQNCGQIGQDP
jgi:hypothetical protein